MSATMLELAVTLRRAGFRLDVDEQLTTSGVTAIFGPSGSGKSTLLRLIAGFERPVTGRITYSGSVWCDRVTRHWTPAHQRNVGYMFQDARLFPHMSVRGNLDFADRRSRARQASYSFDRIVAATGTASLLDRRPGTLSGGERQRVALARTLLARPHLLLFDEPLAALDRNRKAELLPFLETLPTQFGIPAFYVSHDVDEVSRIADRVLILRDGSVEAYGPASEVLTQFGLEAGRNPYEVGSVITCTVDAQEHDHRLTRLKLGENEVWLPLNPSLAPGDTVRVKIPARDVSLALKRPEGLSIQNILAGRITQIRDTEQAQFASVSVDVSGQDLQVRITQKARADLGLSTGQPIFALVKSASFQR